MTGGYANPVSSTPPGGNYGDAAYAPDSYGGSLAWYPIGVATRREPDNLRRYAPGYWHTVLARYSAVPTSLALTSTTVKFVPLAVDPNYGITPDTAAFNVSTAGTGTTAIAIYGSDNGWPGPLYTSSAAMSNTTTGYKTGAFPDFYGLGGWVYLAIATTGSVSINSYASSNFPHLPVGMATATAATFCHFDYPTTGGALPNPIDVSKLVPASGSVPAIYFKGA